MASAAQTEGLTEEYLAEMEQDAIKHGDEGICPADTLELIGEVRRLQNEREDARGLAREYLYALWEEDSEEVRKAARQKEAEFHPWLLEGEAWLK